MKAKVFFIEFGWYIFMGSILLLLFNPSWPYYALLAAAALLRMLVKLLRRKYYLEDLQITAEGTRVQYINSFSMNARA